MLTRTLARSAALACGLGLAALALPAPRTASASAHAPSDLSQSPADPTPTCTPTCPSGQPTGSATCPSGQPTVTCPPGQPTATCPPGQIDPYPATCPPGQPTLVPLSAPQRAAFLAFNLYATHGLPMEITRDVVQEQGFTVDERGFAAAREAHAIASGSGAFGQYETGDNVYSQLLNQLHQSEQLEGGVEYDPYSGATLESEILGLIVNGQITDSAGRGDKVQVVAAATCFYVQAGGEVSDTGWIRTASGEMRVDDTQRPVPGLIVHVGELVKGGLQTRQLATMGGRSSSR